MKTTRRPVVHSPKKEKFSEKEDKTDFSKDEVDSSNVENSQINFESKDEIGLTNVKKMCENFVVDFGDTETRKMTKKPILKNEVRQIYLFKPIF